MTIKEAAAILGCDPRTVTAALSIHGGPIRAVKVGRRVVMPTAPFVAYLEGEPSAPLPASSASQADDATAIIRAKLIELLGALENVA